MQQQKRLPVMLPMRHLIIVIGLVLVGLIALAFLALTMLPTVMLPLWILIAFVGLALVGLVSFGFSVLFFMRFLLFAGRALRCYGRSPRLPGAN